MIISFKFQSDSINTITLLFLSTALVALNSNLILLILLALSGHVVALVNFKFQSDSINTLCRLRKTGVPLYFKFQSDSINTMAANLDHHRIRAL